ncbi:MAG TPA: hypothetical protein VFC67_24215 [Prolixibacteraceae bacterium]|nr:hypothetical protein [Prolixibacteraceae bacterium]
MNKRQINKSRMFETVDAVLDKNSSLFASLPELVSAHQRFKEGKTLILQYRQVQEAETTGLTTSKEIVKTDFINSILKFSAALRAYATSTKNEDLKAKAHYVSSELKKVPDPILFDVGTLLLGLANPIKTELTKYSVSEEEIAEMQTLLPAFKLAYPQQRVATTESKMSTGNIDKVFKSTMKLLKEVIDELMLPFRFSKPDFYNTYKNARIIVNYSGRGKSKPDKPDGSAEGEK